MPIASNKADGTLTAGDHAAHHNELATAANAAATAIATAQAALDALTAATATDAEVAAIQSALTTQITAVAGVPSTPVLQPAPTSVVTIFAAGHAWTQAGVGTNSDDTTDYVRGTQSFKTVTNGAGAQSKMRKVANPAINYTGKAIRITYKITGLSRCVACTLYVGDGTFTNFWTVPLRSGRFNASLPTDDLSAAVRDGEWVTMTIPFSAMTVGGGTPTRTAITDYQVLVQDNSAGTVTCHLNEIAVVPATGTGLSAVGGAITFWFDDGWLSQYTVAKPKLDQYGYGATLPLITDKIGTDAAFCTLAQIQTMERFAGWEIACHAHSNANHSTEPFSFASLTLAQVEADWEAQRAWLLANGLGKGIDIYAYPSGKFSIGTTSMETAARKHFSIARTIDNSFLESCPPQNPYRVSPLGYAFNNTTLVALKAMVDKVAANGGWLNFVFHKLVPAPTLSFEYLTSDFNLLVDYVAASGVPVLTASQAVQAMNRVA